MQFPLRLLKTLSCLNIISIFRCSTFFFLYAYVYRERNEIEKPFLLNMCLTLFLWPTDKNCQHWKIPFMCIIKINFSFCMIPISLRIFQNYNYLSATIIVCAIKVKVVTLEQHERLDHFIISLCALTHKVAPVFYKNHH